MNQNAQSQNRGCLMIFVVLFTLWVLSRIFAAGDDDTAGREQDAPPGTQDTVAAQVAAVADSALAADAAADGEGMQVTSGGLRYTLTEAGVRVDTVGPVTGNEQPAMVTRGDSYIAIDGVRYQFREDGSIVPLDSPRVAAARPRADTADAVETVDPRAADLLSADEALWKPLKEWSGNGTRTTEKFRVGTREWRVVYSIAQATRPQSFLRVQVKNDDDRHVTSMTREGAGTDTSYVHDGPGVFFVEVNAVASRWSVRVEEKHVPAERVARP